MAMIWVDGFDNSNSNSVSGLRWDEYNAASVQTGRFGFYALNTAGSSTYRAVKMSLPAHATYIVHCALQSAGSSGLSPVIGLLSNGVFVGSIRCDMATRAVSYARFDAAASQVTLGTSSVGVMPTSGWFHFQAKVTIDNSAGAVELKVNNNSVLSLTGQDTQSSHASAATGSVSGIVLGAQGTVTNGWSSTIGPWYYDDLVVLNGSGAANNNFLGDIRVQRLNPTANGTTSDFTPTGAATNWQANSETIADGDTSYSSTGTTTHKQLFALGDLTGSPTIHAVQARSYAKKTDAGTANITPLWRSGGTNYSGTLQNLSASYIWHTEIKEQDPNTAAAWTTSGVNALESGVEFTT